MSSPISTYAEVEKVMLSMPRFQEVGARAARFGIDQISEFCGAIGNPEQSYKTVHVAGTNGKGTVCSLIASILKAHGLRTGLYTSPHLVDVRERFRVNGEMVSRQRVLECYKEFESKLEEYPLTFFELTTAMAFRIFEMEQVDFAVIETGLGGRLDATNIVYPEVSVITSIGFDHMEQLGSTIESIAFEKAGILKNKKPFVLGQLSEAAQAVIMQQATIVNALPISDFIQVIQNDDGSHHIQIDESSFDVVCDLKTPMLTVNIKMALEAVTACLGKSQISIDSMVNGISKVQENSGLIGRFEKMHPDYDWYFDGGHNPQALEMVIAHMTKLFPDKKKTVVLSLMSDKAIPEIITLLNKFDHILYYELDANRALKAANFLELIPHAEILSGNISETEKKLANLKTELVLLTGSFYFYKTVSEWMESLPFDSN